MVFKLQLRTRSRVQTLVILPVALAALLSSSGAQASQKLSEAKALYRSGQYFKAARYAFDASEENPAQSAEAYALTTQGLLRAGLYNASSYFFVRTLQSGDKTAIRQVLPFTEELLVRIGGDILRNHLIRHTEYKDYDSVNRSAFLYALAKDAILKGQEKKAIEYLNGMSSKSALWPFGLQLRGTAHALSGALEKSVKDFKQCVKKAPAYVTAKASVDAELTERQRREADDLSARCMAGQARVNYEMDRFNDADRAWDRIPKASFVWTDILFEQAWNAFAKQEYNRTLGKLVSYKSPALQFVFNSEVEVLRAQAYLGLCLYGDANDVINDFNRNYTRVGEQVKSFVEKNSSSLGAFYALGKQALSDRLHTSNDVHRLMNRFVRSPYFQNLVSAEGTIEAERVMAKRFASMQPGVRNDSRSGFPGFVDLVLRWRLKTVRQLGGAFVKNSMIDYHSVLISDFEKMAFIKLEMLGRAKDKLLNRASASGDRSRGNRMPGRQDHQYRWNFNGEFWNDELGDYVFGLESECGS